MSYSNLIDIINETRNEFVVLRPKTIDVTRTGKSVKFDLKSGDRIRVINSDKKSATIVLVGGAELKMIVSKKTLDSLEKESKQ